MYPQEASGPVTHLKLPLTTRQRGVSYCRVLTGVTAKFQNVAFEGPLHRSGSLVPVQEFGPHPTVIECAGRLARGRAQPMVWILWSYDWTACEWREVARAQALNAEWTEVLRLPALQCLNPRPELYDIRTRGQAVAEEILVNIDQRLLLERRDIQVTILTTVYDRIAARITECA